MVALIDKYTVNHSNPSLGFYIYIIWGITVQRIWMAPASKGSILLIVVIIIIIIIEYVYGLSNLFTVFIF